MVLSDLRALHLTYDDVIGMTASLYSPQVDRLGLEWKHGS